MNTFTSIIRVANAEKWIFVSELGTLKIGDLKVRLELVKLNRKRAGFNNSIGYIDVSDKCWRRNVLETTLRCWFSSFLSPTFSIF